MNGSFLSFEPSLYFTLFIGCAVLFLFTLTLAVLKRTGYKALSLTILLLALDYLSQFLIFGFQEQPLLMRLMEQSSVFLVYSASLSFYGYLSRFSGTAVRTNWLDSVWLKIGFILLVITVVFLTPFAVSDKLSYLKGLAGSAYYITDYALLAPLNLLLPFLLVLAGMIRGLRADNRIMSYCIVSLAVLTIFFLLEALFIFGILPVSVLRKGLLMGLAMSFIVWMTAELHGVTSGRSKRDNDRQIEDLRKDIRKQETFINGNLNDISREIESVLSTAEELKRMLAGNEVIFSGLFNMLKESTENRKRQTDTFEKRDVLIRELQNDTGNRALLVPLMLNRWQGFFNEVQGITGSSSDIAQSIDKLISSTDNGKVLIQEHLKATNNIRHSADKVRFIVGLINDVSEQTNILSINAAIEAFRAGEHGRGFSIIAEEIRQVAATTLEESNAISECIARILENSKAEESLVKENDAIYNDFSKTMERLFVYILNVIEVTKELRLKMETLLNDMKQLESSMDVPLQQEQMRQGNFIRETRFINQFIGDGDRLSEDLFQVSSFFAEIEGIRKKHTEYVRMLEEVRAGMKSMFSGQV